MYAILGGCVISEWRLINSLPEGKVENDMLLVRRKFNSADIVIFWIDGKWVYPPHWDDYPGEIATHWRPLERQYSQMDIANLSNNTIFQKILHIIRQLRNRH